jgi:phosphatidylserine decarboxylase
MGIVDQVNDHFVGGTVYQAFLDPWCYHRWHSPISGKVKYSYKLGGTYYLDNPGLPLTGKENYIDSQPMLSVVSVRQIFIIELKEDPSRWVAVIEIGMAEVSGCHPTVVETQ